MTIVFQGHIKSLEADHAPLGKLAVTLQTPMAECSGKEWVIFIPQEHGRRWLPGHAVSFTIYSLPHVGDLSDPDVMSAPTGEKP